MRRDCKVVPEEKKWKGNKKDQGKKMEGEVLRDVIARWLSEQWIHSKGKSKTKEIAKQMK